MIKQEKIVDAVFAVISKEPNCVICGRHSSFLICSFCDKEMLQKLSLSFENRCMYCGRQLVSEKDVCMFCRRQRVVQHADYVFPLFPYELWNKHLLFEWKIKKQRRLVFFFVEYIQKALTMLEDHGIGTFEYIVPVPPRPGKIRKEGWDQIVDVCTLLHKKWKYQVFPILKRISVIQQKHLTRVMRLHSENMFAIDAKQMQRWKIKKKWPEQVVLIDDVMTTGATIESCASLLKTIGIQKVVVVTLFVAQ